MNKIKKKEPRKILVRNTERPVPKTKLIIDDKSEEKGKKDSGAYFKKNTEKDGEIVEKSKYTPQFETPAPNSSLNIAKKIDKIEKLKPPKNKNVAYCEKVTRVMNFPSDQPIYKDLIPLEVPARTPMVLSARDPLPQKDIEPVLATFAKPKPGKEFIYQPSFKLEKPQIQPQLNNLRLYQIIQMHQ